MEGLGPHGVWGVDPNLGIISMRMEADFRRRVVLGELLKPTRSFQRNTKFLAESRHLLKYDLKSRTAENEVVMAFRQAREVGRVLNSRQGRCNYRGEMRSKLGLLM